MLKKIFLYLRKLSLIYFLCVSEINLKKFWIMNSKFSLLFDKASTIIF
jgi:hypothetical protein